MCDKLSRMIDKIASKLESKGFLREAHDLDVVANTIDSIRLRPTAEQESLIY